jgi:hypothetical protein
MGEGEWGKGKGKGESKLGSVFPKAHGLLSQMKRAAQLERPLLG